ncbi:MAG: class I SAM-dependent methyltransferase [Clostridia bacterium]|nr:class I SAM-dependent methyltransferase [Clostridia bacterium]
MKGAMDFYDKTAPDWARRGYESDDVPCLLDFVRRLAPGSRILELCCGCGYDARRMHALGYEVVGVDFSGESLKIARAKNPDIAFYNDNILNDYSYVGPVDAIVVIAGLVHIETAQLPLAFRRMRDVLKPGGSLFVTVREGEGRMEERSVAVIDGETYDRNFIGHTLEELTASSAGLFEFEREVADDGTGWRNYIFTGVPGERE